MNSVVNSNQNSAKDKELENEHGTIMDSTL
jgi:hypothetical protein